MTVFQLVLAAAGLVAINIAAVGAFWWDKRQARIGGWRVAESNLLMLALFGGWLGAKFAQRRLRHKTRKEPFRTQLNLIPLLYAIVAIALLWRHAA